MRILCSGETRAKSTFFASSATLSSSSVMSLRSLPVMMRAWSPADDADAPGDRLGGQTVVAGDHDDFDAGGGALLDGDGDLVARRIHHRHETDEDRDRARSLPARSRPPRSRWAGRPSRARAGRCARTRRSGRRSRRACSSVERLLTVERLDRACRGRGPPWARPSRSRCARTCACGSWSCACAPSRTAARRRASSSSSSASWSKPAFFAATSSAASVGSPRIVQLSSGPAGLDEARVVAERGGTDQELERLALLLVERLAVVVVLARRARSRRPTPPGAARPPRCRGRSSRSW